MLIVDASCLFEVVADAASAEAVRSHLVEDQDHAAPHLVDAEVLSVVRRHHLIGELDVTAARLAIDDLRDWPGERVGHRGLLERAWELRDRVRPWDGLYVALAEAFEARLLTLDRRLARVGGLGCEVIVPV